jgi:hypothetical protein
MALHRATYVYVSGFPPEGDKSPLQMIQGGYPPQIELFSGFENLITLSVILRHLEAELIILRCLKLIRGLFFSIFLSPSN